MNKLLLIDGHSILNRAFYGLPDLTSASGLHTNAVYGFLNILFKLLDEEKPDGLAVAFDVHAPTFRHKMFPDYKGTRKPMAEELRAQVPMMKEMLSAMGVPVVTKEGFEADDILGTLARQAEASGSEVVIVSGDRDLLQLATARTRICIPKTKATGTTVENYFDADVEAAYGVTPKEFIDVKALWGDASDNIPGVPGIGEKTAKAIIAQYHSIENARDHAADIRPPRASRNLEAFYDQAVLSKTLATIDTAAPVSLSGKEAALGDLFTPEAQKLCREWNFKNLLSRFEHADSSESDEETDVRFETVTDPDEVSALFARLKKADTATIGLSFYLQDHTAVFAGMLRWMALSDGENAWYLPMDAGFSEPALRQGICELLAAKKQLAMPQLKPFLSWWQADGTEAKTEDALCANAVFDTSLAAYLLWPLSGSYSASETARQACGLSLPVWEELFGKKKPAEIWRRQEKTEQLTLALPALQASDAEHEPQDPDDLPGAGHKKKASDAARLTEDDLYEAKKRFACSEAYGSAVSAPALTALLEAQGMTELYRELELPLVFVLHQMEREGITLDTEALRAYGERLSVRIGELEKDIWEQAGKPFNIQSPKQLGAILFEKLGLPGGKKTKTGYSTAAEVLEGLAPFSPVVADVLEYRQLTKLKSTYADGLSACVSKDGRVHTTFMQTVTATGRLSSADPNLQNIPVRMELGRQIRKVFPAREGCLFVDADYSQIELRVLAHMSGDAHLVAAYREGQDIHRSTASRVFHVPFEEVTDLQRRNAKAVNFGIVYGISAFGLSQDLGISRQEAQAYIDDYFAAYPQLHAFLEGLVASAKEKGYAETLYGRRRPVPELSASAFPQRQFGERVAMNMPVQGTAADIIKRAMLLVSDRLGTECPRARLLLQVHDELLVETPVEEAPKVRRILEEEMPRAAELLVPLAVDVHEGRTWFEAK